MNKQDKDNLNFILNSMDSKFEEWMLNASADDIEYAIELVRKARIDLYEQEHQLTQEIEESSLTEAQEVLARIMAK